MSTWRIYEYSLDKDLTKISFKRFHRRKDDVYPSISLCFFNPYLPDKLKEYDTNLTVPQYTKFLQGKFWHQKLVDVEYENVTVDLKDYLLGYDIWYSEKGCMMRKDRVKTEEQKLPKLNSMRPKIRNKEQISYKSVDDINKNELGWKTPYVSSAEPNAKCFTIDIPFQSRKILRSFNIRIRTKIFRNNMRPSKYIYNVQDGTADGFMVLFHYPKQILNGKVKGKKNWPIREINDSKNYVMEFNLQNIEVVNNRKKGRTRCRNFPFDQDIGELQKIVDMAGCVSPFMKINNKNMSMCKTKEEMDDAYNAFLEYDANRDDYVEDICCRYLTKFDLDYWEYELIKDDADYFNITINYIDSKYREVREIKAFNIYALFGNIGGYVGIFIGYAFFHVPGILIKIKNGVSKKKPEEIQENTDEKEDLKAEC